MAGDWLKMEHATPDKSETLAITAAMGWDDPDLTLGKLFRIWRWFDQQTTDGNAPSVTPALLDRIVGVTGFARAMADVGWLIISDVGVSLPNFDRHNGKTAKARALTAKRAKDFRENKPAHKKDESNAKSNAERNGERNAGVTLAPLPREDKREENTQTESARAKPPDFEAAARVYAKLQKSALKEIPPEQAAVSLVTEFGEELVNETLIDCENEYAGKGWRYFERILIDRRDHPEKRPGERRKANGNGRERERGDNDRPARKRPVSYAS